MTVRGCYLAVTEELLRRRKAGPVSDDVEEMFLGLLDFLWKEIPETEEDVHCLDEEIERLKEQYK